MKDLQNYSLLRHNTFGIDARCRRFVEYETLEELLGVLPSLAASPVLHIGEGSNLLFTSDYDGTVLHSAIRGLEVTDAGGDSVLVRAGAGENWDGFVAETLRRGLYGLENLSLIPGEVGACAVQNIGAYGVEAGRFIERVETVELASGARRDFSGAECAYAYRSSLFKGAEKGRRIVTHVVFRLSRRFVPEVGYAALARELQARGLDASRVRPEEVRDLVCDVRRAKLPDPAETGSAGSFFMNPVVPEDKFRALQAAYPGVPHYPAECGVKVPAGWLIQQAGWKGRSLGQAGVWPLQALVLVNLGGATGQDIVRLSQAIRQDVKECFGVDLQPEVNFI